MCFFFLKLFFIVVFVQASFSEPPNHSSTSFKSPKPTFSFGVATEAYHIEGAWNQDGKIESIWDHLTHINPKWSIDGTNLDVASNAYNKVDEDIKLVNDIGAKHFRFSIPWTRILTATGKINQAGVYHYQHLLALLKKYQIIPIAAIYNGDLPQYLQDQGGFLNNKFADWYLKYAKTLFEIFGSHIKHWLTFNSVNRICIKGYGDGTYAPGIKNNSGVNEYICAHNLLKAHAAAYRLYDQSYRSTQRGKISIAIDTQWYEPNSDSTTDASAAELRLQFQFGMWAHPLYHGNYPEPLIARIDHVSKWQGFSKSRLPKFSKKEIESIKGTLDFFSINFDKSTKCSANLNKAIPAPSYSADTGANLVAIKGDMTFGIRKLIAWIKKMYSNPPILITGDGLSTKVRDLKDDDRVTYIQDVLDNVKRAISEDNARICGYTYVVFLDGWQAINGFTDKWGLYDVDFDSPNKTRTPRKSAKYYKSIAKDECTKDSYSNKNCYVWE